MRITWDIIKKTLEKIFYGVCLVFLIAMGWTAHLYALCGMYFGLLLCYECISRWADRNPALTMNQLGGNLGLTRTILFGLLSVTVGIASAYLGFSVYQNIIWLSMTLGFVMGVCMIAAVSLFFIYIAIENRR